MMAGGRELAVIVGVGPGLGAALCRGLARAGYTVAGLARSTDFLGQLAGAMAAEELEFSGYSCDVTDADQVRAAFEELRGRVGVPRVLVYNAGAFLMKPLAETRDQDFVHLWEVNCRGAYLCSRQVVSAMIDAGRGTIVFTGATASVKPGAQFAAFGSSKAALRGLALGMARELGPQGVHVAHVIIDGVIWTSRTRTMSGVSEANTLRPEDIVEAYLALIRQPRSAWTLEMDLRPDVEPF
jgi:NAD(P)-dependent dehydrogenase (short-subunit alcohol dehydrogenase family)